MCCCLRVPKSLGESKVNEVDARRFLRSNEEIVWLDVSVEEVIGLNVLYSL